MLGMAIGEVAVNVIVLELKVVPVMVSFNFPDTLYVPLTGTVDGEITRLRETLCFRVL